MVNNLREKLSDSPSIAGDRVNNNQVGFGPDRLGRVGVYPDAARLCTDAAKVPETIKWADGRARSRVIPEIVAKEWEIDTRGREG